MIREDIKIPIRYSRGQTVHNVHFPCGWEVVRQEMIREDIKIPIRFIEYTVYTSTLNMYLGEVVR
jgi:hypothetical protein